MAGDRLYALWLLLATTGLRRGEALGLPWEDVATAGRSSCTGSGPSRRVGRRPRSQDGHSRRRIALDAETVAALRRHRVRQLEERLAADVAWQDSGAVFVQLDGRELHPKVVSNWFTAHVKASGLPTIRPHDVRHSYATIALTGGVPITVVSRRLGHASVTITLDVYSHVLPTDDTEAAAKWLG